MPTADEVAVSVSADFREYDRQTKQSIDEFEARMSGMAKTAQDAANVVDAAQKKIGQSALSAADKEQQAAERSEASQRKKEIAHNRWVLNAQRGTAQFIASQEEEARKLEQIAERERKALEARNAAALNSAGIASGVVGAMGPNIPYQLRGPGQGGGYGGFLGGAMNTGFGGNRGGIGGLSNFSNVSYQLQDIFVQLAGGQQAMLVMSQQLPQLLMGFGSLGIAAGVAAAAVGLLSKVFFDIKDPLALTKEATASFNAAVSSTEGVVKIADAALANYRSTLSLVQRGYVDLAKLDLDRAIRDNVRLIDEQSSKLQTTVDALRGKLSENTANQSVDILGNAFGNAEKTLNSVEDQYRAFLERLTTIKPRDLDALTELLAQLNALQTEFENAGFAVQPLKDAIQALIVPIDNAAKQQKQLADLNKEVTETSAFATDAVRLLNNVFGDGTFVYDAATGALKLAAFAMDDTGEAASRNASKIEGFIAKLDMIASYSRSSSMLPRPTPSTGLQFGNSGAPNNGTNFGGGSLGDALASLYGEPQPGPTPAGFDRSGVIKNRPDAGAKAAERQAAALDKSNTKIAQTVDLNQRLIEVYHQGEAARARVIAQYDAEREAINRNLKVGSEQYTQFVDNYVQQAEQARLSELTLDHYKQGEALTKSLMTRQEAYNAQLAQYNKWLSEGAINAETYQRAIAQLDAANNGYAEGIQAVGDAFNQGINSAEDFDDALNKILLSLLQLSAQAAVFGTGPLAKLFDNIFGTSGGLFGFGVPGGLGGGGGISFGSDGLPTESFYNDPAAGGGSSGLGWLSSALSFAGGLFRAGGGQVRPGRGYTVGEMGRETFFPSVPGTIIPNSPDNSGTVVDNKVTFFINATGDKQVAAAAAAAGQAAYLRAMRDMPGALEKRNTRKVG